MGSIDHLTTSGIFSLDGEDFDVDNNVWIVGDDRECVVLDCAHDHEAIIGAVGDRTAQGHRVHARPQRSHQRSCRGR